MKAVNIEWDTDGDMEVLEYLPTEIEIPEEILNDDISVLELIDIVSDYISTVTGFCHNGFELA